LRRLHSDADALVLRIGLSSLKMSVQHKILRTANAPNTNPDDIETAVAQAIIDLENSNSDLKAELRPLQISAAREVDVRGGKKAIVVFVPVPQLKAFHKVQARCAWILRLPK
jgi:small subunit ribosomal protein S7e